MGRDVKVTQNLRYEAGATADVAYVKNGSGGALVPGDVVIWKTATNTGDDITTTTSADDKLVAGVVKDNIPDGAWGYIYLARDHVGAITTLKVDGTTDIAVGDELSTFTTAKIAAKAGAGKGGHFAIALEAYTTNDSSGVINAILHSPPRVDSLASSASLDDGYNNGTTITVDGAAVVLAGSHATNDVLQITNATGSGALIDLAQSGTGNDIEGTSDTWVVTKAGVATFVGITSGATAITVGAGGLDMNGVDITLDADADSKLVLGTDDVMVIQLGGATEYTFNATELDLQGNNLVGDADADTYFDFGTDDIVGIYIGAPATLRYNLRPTAIQFAGGNYTINDSNNNEVIGVEAVASATTYANFKNSNGSYMDLEALGTADVGFRFLNDQDEIMLRLTPVATATVYLDIINSATGGPVLLKTIGENDRGFTFQNAEAEEVLELTNTASATNGLKVNAQTTGSNVEIGANCTGATANRGVSILDSNGNELWIMSGVANAILELTYSNAVTGSNPGISVTTSGSENQGITFDTTGTGTHRMITGAAETNTIKDALSLWHESSGNGAAGFGVGLAFQLENGASQCEEHGSIDMVLVTATDAAEDSDMVFSVMDGGSVGEALRILGSAKVLQAGDGVVGNPAYGFKSDVDTGLYLAATGIIALTSGGTAQINFDFASATKGLQFLQVGDSNILDGGGNEYLYFTATGSATTAVEILNMSTGTTGPLIRAKGETNINLRIGGIGTGQLNIVNATAGGAAAPDIVIAGDVDSGIFGGTNIIAIATAGVEAFRVAATSNIHIGGTAGAGTNAGTDSLYMYNAATNPSGTITNGVAYYVSAGEAYILDAGGTATLQS